MTIDWQHLIETLGLGVAVWQLIAADRRSRQRDWEAEKQLRNAQHVENRTAIATISAQLAPIVHWWNRHDPEGEA